MTVVVVLTIGIIFTGLLRNADVQTFMARVTAIHLSEYLDAQVKIDKLRVSAFFNMKVEGVEINDLQNKPLIYIKSLYLSADLFNAIKSDFAFGKVEIDSANVFIRKYAGSDRLNIVCILNRFKQDTVVSDTFIHARSDFELKIEQFEIKNSRFIYQIEEKIKLPEFGIDYFDMDVQNIDILLNNISFFNDSITGYIKHLSAHEKSGFQLSHFEGDIIVYDQGMELKYGLLETPQSNLEFNLNFTYPSWRSYNRFIDEVKLTGEFFSGEVNTSDIAFFAPAMEGMDNPFELKGTFSGPVRNLRVRNLFLTTGNETTFRGNIQMTGLPKIYETFISLRIREFSTSVNDIQQFKIGGGRVLKELPKTITSLGIINVKGNLTGFYNDFVSNANFRTNIGQLTTDIQFSNNPNRDIIEYRGDFQGRQFDLGRFLNRQEYFGKLDFDLQVNGEGLDLETLNANVEGEINRFQFKDRRLDDIAINGLFQERQFTGDFSINDELIRADFQGHINFDTLVPLFDFNLNLAETHLALLGLLPIDSSAVLTSKIKLNFSGNTLDNIRGDIQLDSTVFFYKNEQYLMQAFKMETASDFGKNRTINIRSDFIDGKVDGEFQLSELKNTANLFLGNYLPNLFPDTDILSKQSTNNIEWDIRFKNFSHILPLLHPQLQISEDGQWLGSFDFERNALSSQVELRNAVYHGVKFNDLLLEIYNDKQSLHTDLAINSVVFKEEAENDTLQLSIDNFRFSSLVYTDSIHFDFGWNNEFKPIKNTAELKGYMSLSEKDLVDLKFNKADLMINDTNWVIHPENRFRIGENQLLFEKVGFYSGSQLVEVTGAIDKENEQALKINFNNFDVSNFDILLNYKGIDLDGLIDGDIQFINIFKNIDFLADLQISDLKVNKEIIGDATINSKRNQDKSIFVNAEIVRTLENSQIQKPLVFEGFYFPNQLDNSLDFSLFLDKLPVQVASPFLYKWVDHLDGSISGNAFVRGRLEKPDIKGDFQLDDVKFRIIYLNTNYKLTANAEIDNSFINLKNADLRDQNNNRADIFGGLFHNHLKDFGVDVSIRPQKFMGLNTRRGMNSLYYGKAFVTGTVDIKGYFDAVELDIKLEASEGSELVIPINLTADISDNEFITFVSYTDTLLEKPEKKQIKELSNFSLNMDLALNPSAQVNIILPEDLGNIKAVGFGDLNMNLNRAGNFTMAGDYQVNKGTFLFTIKNVYKKRFDLVDGGTISWTGDPYAGELNMKALYHVKTSLKTLGATQDTSFRTRVPVDCVIGLKDKILNPSIKFSFEFPNSPEEVRQLVFSQIDTTNEAEMAQQMLSLLVLNSFSFSSAIGNEDFASNVGGSSLQLVANQLSNWLSQISPDLDVGIHYRPGGAITNEEVEVALSTQLFDERVTIDGNFGYQNTNNLPSSNASNIVGDINVEVKITKDGHFRLRAFNRTNTVDLIDNTAPYTQGVGVFYRKEFNTLRELFRRKRKKEKAESEVSDLQNSVAIKEDKPEVTKSSEINK